MQEPRLQACLKRCSQHHQLSQCAQGVWIAYVFGGRGERIHDTTCNSWLHDMSLCKSYQHGVSHNQEVLVSTVQKGSIHARLPCPLFQAYPGNHKKISTQNRARPPSPRPKEPTPMPDQHVPLLMSYQCQVDSGFSLSISFLYSPQCQGPGTFLFIMSYQCPGPFSLEGG